MVVRNHIAESTFSKETYKDIFKKSDQVFDSNQSTTPRGATVAAVGQPTPSEPEVSALRPQRGGARGGRGNRGGGSSRGARGGQANQPPNPTNASGNTNTNQNKGPRHATAKGADDKLCKIHYKWGENSTYCAAPWKCPMKNVYKSPQ